MTRRRLEPQLMLTMLSFALSIAACAQDTSDDATSSALTADALTSATPGIAQFVLSDKHAGWGQRGCFTCHDSLHTSGFSAPQCSHCHGTNGAPVRKAFASGADHPDGNCQSCHADQHPSEGFTPPNDCRGCHRFEKIAQGCTHTEDYDVVVVGGGGGGLSAASVLAQAGKSVLLIEQSYKVGGAMVNFYRGDFRFEASLHAMDGMGLQYLSILGIADKLKVLEGTTMFQVATSELTFEVPADVVEYQSKLKSQFPEHADNIGQLFTDMSGAMEGMDFSKFEGKSTLAALAEYNITPEDKSLFNIVTSLVGFVAGGLDIIPAAMYVGMWYTMHHMNYAYFEGGSQSITDALTEVIEEAGGIIKTHSLATKIVIEGGKATQVVTDEGGCYNASVVVSNVNEPSTYLGLIGSQHLPAELVTRLNTKEPAPTISTVFLATNKDFTSYFPGGGHEIFVFGDGVGTSEYQQSVYCQMDDQGVAITNYSVLDPTAAPAGKNVITISNAIGYDCNDQWKFGDSWESYNAYKWEIAQKTIEKAEAYLPGLSEHIEVLEVGSPQTIEAYTKNPKGSWSGWAIEPNMADPLAIVAPEKHLSPFPNLFLTGAWVTLGGQSVVLMSGKAAADLVLEALSQE